MRILGGKSKEERQSEVKEHDLQVKDADSVPELQSGMAEDYLDDSIEDIDAREKIHLKGHTPTLKDYQEQTNQESIKNEPKVPFLNSFKLDLKTSNVGKRFDVEEGDESDIGVEPSFHPSAITTSSSLVPLSPIELEYLEKLRQGPLPEVVTLTKSSVRTETVLQTSTITLMKKGREAVTTLITPVGMTTFTDTRYVTTTQVPPSLLAPSTTIITSPVVYQTVVTQTDSSEYNIRFRNEFITRTLLNTRLVTTMTTTYRTATHAILPYQSTYITLTESTKSPIHKRRTNILTRRRNVRL